MLYIDLRPGQTCHSKVMHRKEVTHSDGSYERKSRRRAWLKKWDKVKILWYTHRLMHRKGVTCELHDSYFRLMTIKHAIPKIEWAIELSYNSKWTGSQWVGVRRVRDKMWSRKPPDQLVRRCWNVNMSQRGWAPRPSVEQPRRTRTTHGDVRRGWGGQYVAVFVQSPTASHTQLKDWVVVFIVSSCSLWICICV